MIRFYTRDYNSFEIRLSVDRDLVYNGAYVFDRIGYPDYLTIQNVTLNTFLSVPVSYGLHPVRSFSVFLNRDELEDGLHYLHFSFITGSNLTTEVGECTNLEGNYKLSLPFWIVSGFPEVTPAAEASVSMGVYFRYLPSLKEEQEVMNRFRGASSLIAVKGIGLQGSLMDHLKSLVTSSSSTWSVINDSNVVPSSSFYSTLRSIDPGNRPSLSSGSITGQKGQYAWSAFSLGPVRTPNFKGNNFALSFNQQIYNKPGAKLGLVYKGRDEKQFSLDWQKAGGLLQYLPSLKSELLRDLKGYTQNEC